MRQQREVDYLQSLLRERARRRAYLERVATGAIHTRSDGSGEIDAGFGEQVDNRQAGFGQPAPVYGGEPCPIPASTRGQPGTAAWRCAPSSGITAATCCPLPPLTGPTRCCGTATLRARRPGIGNDAYETAFAKMLADPQMGHLRYGPAEVEGVREAGYAQAAASRAILLTSSAGVPLPFCPLASSAIARRR